MDRLTKYDDSKIIKKELKDKTKAEHLQDMYNRQVAKGNIIKKVK